jgi:hypothetical protein
MFVFHLTYVPLWLTSCPMGSLSIRD